MPVTFPQMKGRKGARGTATVIALTSTPADFDHGLGSIPACVLDCQIKVGPSTAATVCYDRVNSTKTKMRLSINVAGPLNYVIIPVAGNF